MSSAISASKARRMRDAATKRRMFCSISKTEIDNNVNEEIVSMISHVRELTFAVQSLLGVASPLFCAPWMEGYSIEENASGKDGATSAHQWSTDAAPFQPYDTVGQVLQELVPESCVGPDWDARLYSGVAC